MRLLGLWTLILAMPAQAATIRKGPYLIYRNEPTRMVVAWQTDRTPQAVIIEWGVTKQYGNRSAGLKESGSGLDEHLFVFTIEKLTPGARCYYRVNVDGVEAEGDFRAAPDITAKTAVVYAYGDTRSHPDVHDRVCAGILRDMKAAADTRQTVVLHLGDWVTSGGSESDWDEEYFNKTNKHTGELLAHLPVMGCLGNHDGSGAIFRKYRPYDYPNPQSCYYGFEYGPVRMVVVDLNDPFGAGSRQYEWLNKTLARPASWKIALLHEPAWSAGGHSNHSGVQTQLMPLLKSHGVSLVLAGHNHYYARAQVDGITHVTTGGGGAPLYMPDAHQPNVLATAQMHHFVRMEFTETALHGTAMDDTGHSLDSFTIAPPSDNK